MLFEQETTGPVRRSVAGTKRILLIEDRASFRQSLALLLEWRTGLECVHGASLAEARRILDEIAGAPLVAIIDLDLPDAIELLEQLRRWPALALTAGRSLELRARALEAGADEVLSTASPVEEIIGTVQRFVGR